MKQIVWIFGVSASGKETFINSLLEDSVLQKMLSIKDKRIAISKQSLKNLGKLDQSRASVLDEVFNLILSNEVVLIKWQYGDTLLGTPNTLCVKFPTLKHTCVKLTADKPEQARRLKTKTWWHDIDQEDEFLASEGALVGSSIKKLPPNFEVIELQW